MLRDRIKWLQWNHEIAVLALRPELSCGIGILVWRWWIELCKQHTGVSEASPKGDKLVLHRKIIHYQGAVIHDSDREVCV